MKFGNKKKASLIVGCLSNLTTLVVGFLLFSLIHNLLSVNKLLLLIICLVLSFRLIKLFTRHRLNFLILISLLGSLIILLAFNTSTLKTVIKKEYKALTKNGFIVENNDSIPIFFHNRTWIDYSGQSYKGKFSIRQNDYKSSKAFHNSIYIDKNYIWTELYSKLYEEDINKLDLILNEFYYIHKTYQLNRREFAEMIVSFVQDIPYSFVFQQECLNPSQYEQYIRDILAECPECCIGNQKFGIQSPVEFLSNLKGDCDTRTVLIYSILTYFGYDVAILNSNYYLHSIIGIAIPAHGKYLSYNGKKYYFWETTNKFYQIGDIPNQFGNPKHWHIALTN